MRNIPKTVVIALLALGLIIISNGTARQPALAAQGTAAPTAPATVRGIAITPTRLPTGGPSITPTPQVIVDTGYENLFPMLIRFWTVTAIPLDRFLTVKLRIFQSGAIDQTINLPLKEVTRKMSETATILYFAWPLTADNAPIPFQEMSYQFTIETTDKVLHVSPLGKIEFSDMYKMWYRSEDAPIRLYWHGGLTGGYLRDSLMRAYNLLLAQVGAGSEYNFVIYEPQAEPCETDPTRPGQKIVIGRKDRTFFPCDPKQAMVVYAARGFTMIQRNTPSIEQLQDNMIAVMAARSYGELFRTAAQPPPAWFKSGVIGLYGLVGRGNALLLSRDQARQDRLLTLDELAAPAIAKKDDFGASVRNWNAQAYMLTLYLSARFGAQTPFTMARAIGNKSTFEDALKTVSGDVTLTQLYNDWKFWLVSPEADAAIRWNVYQTAPTPTVTPTETAYPTFPPITPEVFPSDTPYPTRTPRPSLTPEPTNTARPPGSLLTPSAVPASAIPATGAATPTR